MSVPFLDVGAAYRELEHPIDAAITRVLRSGHFILGPEVESFERRFAAYTGAKHCVGVGNGLEALALALAAHGIGNGDEVIVPAATAVATWLAVTLVGAVPVPAAVSEATLTLEPDRLDAAVTPRTRAVIPVHLYGHSADLGPICDIARRYGLVVIDDAAQAHGARYRERPIGGLVSATTFSFYPSKNLGAMGDGGAVTTDDDAIADRVRALRNYGAARQVSQRAAGLEQPPRPPPSGGPGGEARKTRRVERSPPQGGSPLSRRPRPSRLAATSARGRLGAARLSPLRGQGAVPGRACGPLGAGIRRDGNSLPHPALPSGRLPPSRSCGRRLS